jgi:protein involved in polysaccharide export with SLBB domain
MNPRKWAGRFGAALALAGALLVFPGCKSASPKTEFSSVQGGPDSTTTAQPVHNHDPADTTSVSTAAAPLNLSGNLSTETLSVGNILNIKFQDVPGPVPDFDGKIKEDGTITLFLNQTFTAAGKTVGELAKEIRERYVPKYYKYMTVNIAPQMLFFYIGGEVKSPGQHPYISRIKLLEAIQSAGDFTEYARRGKVIVTRGANGQRVVVDAKKAKTHPELNIEIYPNDRIEVTKSPL